MKPLTVILLLALSTSARAETIDQLPFVRALNEGRAVAPLPDEAMFQQAASEMKRITGDPGPVTVLAVRLFRFEKQPLCGRIAFGLYQESRRQVWGQAGGQLNICQNGLPPDRICPEKPKTLVPFDAKCRNGQASIDTPEVAAAVQAAVAAGGLSEKEVFNRIHRGPK